METSFARVIEEHLELKRRNVAQARSDPGRDRTSDDLGSEPVRGRAREFDRGD